MSGRIVKAVVIVVALMAVYLAVSVAGVGTGGYCRGLCTIPQEHQSEQEDGE